MCVDGRGWLWVSVGVGGDGCMSVGMWVCVVVVGLCGSGMYVCVDVGVWVDGRYDEVDGYRWVGGC